MNYNEYIKEAQVRARRRKSPWNFILLLLSMVCIGGCCFILTKAIWLLHTVIYPEHKGHFNEFWQDGISFPSFISSFLLMIPLFFASLPLGMIFANIIVWCIPPARKTFDQEAKGYKGTSFKESMQGLLKLSLIIVPTCLLLSLIGAFTLKTLK